jgi:SAM-dependent methyltransferase
VTKAYWSVDSEAHFLPPGNFRDYIVAIEHATGCDPTTLGKVLDVGCNRGWGCGIFSDYYGIDVNEATIASAREHWEPRLAERGGTTNEDRFTTLKNPKSPSLPYDNDSFNLIFAKDVLEHLVAPVESIREFARILKPGGWVFLVTPDAQPWVWRDPTHIRPYPLTAHVGLAQISGLTVVQQGYESVAPGTQKIARTLGRGRTPALVRSLTKALPWWPRNAWSVLQKA